ncbi:hypothetical protein [Pseudomonas sp. Pdm06]|uniref:hypothetical protein n=1 Tax=Pseudomonas sp. Pdm06 TaxID=1790044 RepID=UPI00177B8F9E|nr:hypothetical protein [Pseudomonas sp. Pdm06]MBD9464433.1 hypothetical protein [Pseudomonas sp. Pdm06]
MNNSYLDVRDFGAIGDGITDDALAFQRCSDAAFLENKTISATGRFLIKQRVLIYTNIDFANAHLIMDSGGLAIMEHPEQRKQRSFSVAKGDFAPTHLIYLGTDLSGTLPSDIIDEYAESFVVVSSDDIYIFRNGDRNAPQKKSTVTLMTKYGRLVYPLSFDYSRSATVTIKLRKLPQSRLRIKAPSIEVKGPVTFPIFQINRDLVDVIGFRCICKTFDDTYYALTSCSDCYDVSFYGVNLPGYGWPAYQPGISPKAIYDVILNACLKMSFSNISGNTGWKTIDGNNVRNVSVVDSELEAFHCHFNAQDIQVRNCVFHGKGCSFGTGSDDSVIEILDCKFMTRSWSALGMRTDYGELRGTLIVENCTFQFVDKAQTRTTCILVLDDSAIRLVDQPETYALPANIFIRNIKIFSKQACELISFPTEDHYNNQRKLLPPRNINISGVDATTAQGGISFDYAFLPFNGADSDVVNIRLEKIRMPPSRGFILRVGAADTRQSKVHFCLKVIDVDAVYGFLMGSRKSEIHIRDSSASRLRCYWGGHAQLKSLSIENVLVKFGSNYNDNDISLDTPQVGFVSVVDCVFDASAYKAATGNTLSLGSSTAHRSSNNVAIECYGSHDNENFDSLGRKPIIPGLGRPSNYTVGPDGLLVRNWP